MGHALQPVTAPFPSLGTVPIAPILLSFDVEEHQRIEAAANLNCSKDLCEEYGQRMESSTRWILEELDRRNLRATFYVVGEIAQSHPELIRAMTRAGHEVGSHSWNHRRVSRLSPEEFRADLRRSKDLLEQVGGEAVVGYRAPTFSIGRKTPWAIDILVEEGFRYDSSIYPVRHDRYGEPQAPRTPFQVRGVTQSILEIPPLTWRCARINLPVGGGGYFRLFPLALMELGFGQMRRHGAPALSMIYFHPWEFDPDQPQLPLPRLSRFRTYVGTKRSRPRLQTLLDRHPFGRAIDAVASLEASGQSLPTFSLSPP